MTAKRSGDLFKPFEQSFLIKALLFPLGLIYRLWALSVRFEYAEEDGFQEISESNTPLVFFFGIIVCFWPVNGTDASGEREPVMD